MNLPPILAVQAQQEYVQTGWTHQRVDGGPDQRFSNNPPVGYYRIVGYVLNVCGVNFEFPREPTDVIATIRTWSDMYFRRLEPNAKALLRTPLTPHPALKVRGSTVQCPSCGKVQEFVEGKIASTN